VTEDFHRNGRVHKDVHCAVSGDLDLFKAHAKGLAGGLEPELSVVAEVLFPIAPITDAVGVFQARFPATSLKLYTEARCALVQQVIDGRRPLGIIASLPPSPRLLTSERPLTIRMAMVVSPHNPLTIHAVPIPTALLAEHVQLVHTDPSDLGRGDLIQVSAEETPAAGHVVAMSANYRTDSPPGPAGRWFIDHIKQTDAQQGQQPQIGPSRITPAGSRPRLSERAMQIKIALTKPCCHATRGFPQSSMNLMKR
jgi:DNA-binding transcriptional LysR family regulator